MSPTSDDPEVPSDLSGHSWNPDTYSKNAGFVAELGMPVLDLLSPLEGERILDLGCGDGVLTEKIVSVGADVIGIDSSPDQILAAAAKGLDARLASGEAISFYEEFDAVFSNAALHWILRPEAVIAGVWRALKPGGRFVGEFGGEGNVATVAMGIKAALKERGIDSDPLTPWYFPSAEEYAKRLKAGGFNVESIALIERPTPLPGPLDDWLELFAQSFLNGVPDGQRENLKQEIAHLVKDDLCREDGVWVADYVRLRFKSFKSEE